VRALEDLLIQSIYDGLVTAKLDQRVNPQTEPCPWRGGEEVLLIICRC
jgi:hypothetical protein